MPTRKGGPRRQRRATREAAPPAAAAKQPVAPADAEEASAAPAATAAEKRATRRNPDFPLGVDLMPLDDESAGPEGWYAREVGEDLATIAKARLTLVRIHLSWRLAEPQVGQYDEDVMARIGELLDECAAHKLQAIVVFFGDDRHSELSEVTWGTKRDPRSDGYLIQRQVAFVQQVVGAHRSHKAVFAWQLADEAFCSRFTSAEELEAWAEQLREAVRELDPKRPLALGCDGETLARATGIDGRETLASFEFGVSHATAPYISYAAPGPITSGPPTWLDGFLLRLSQRGWPVLADAVGAQSFSGSLAEEAAFLRTSLWSALLNRGAGAVVRRLRDFEPERREPFYVDPYETLVGVLDSEGEPKPAFGELAAFARTVANIDLRATEPVPERVAVMLPSERYRPLPDLAGLFDPRACLTAFITAKQAHVPVTVIDEEDDFDAYAVIIVASALSLADATWDRLSAFVQRGGSLMFSFGGGDAPVPVRDLFGVEFLGDGGPRDELSVRIAQPDILGPLVSFDARLDVPSFAMLTAVTATVVATDERGNPLLTVNQVGQGRAIFLACPIERAMAQSDVRTVPEAVAAFQRTVIASAAGSAGCASPVLCDLPEVEIAVRTGERDLVMLLNHSPASVTATLMTERTVATIADVRGGEPVAVGATRFGVPLGPNAGLALVVTYAAK